MIPKGSLGTDLLTLDHPLPTCYLSCSSHVYRGVVQPGSTFDWGSKGRRFKSSRPDHVLTYLPRAQARMQNEVHHEVLGSTEGSLAKSRPEGQGTRESVAANPLAPTTYLLAFPAHKRGCRTQFITRCWEAPREASRSRGPKGKTLGRVSQQILSPRPLRRNRWSRI